MEELTCEQQREGRTQAVSIQFSELLRTAKLSEMLVCRQVRTVISFCETSFVVSFFCFLVVSLSTLDTLVCDTSLLKP